MTSIPYGRPLSGFQVLQSSDLDEVQELMSNLYGPVGICPASGAHFEGVSIHVAPLGPLAISAMFWDSGIDARSDQLDGCFDFCSALRGSSNTKVGNRMTEFGSQQQGIALSPIQPMQVLNAGPLDSLNIKVPVAIAESRLRALIGEDVVRPLDFKAVIDLRSGMRSVWRFLNYVVTELEADRSLALNPLVAEQFAETLLLGILYEQPHNYSDLLQRRRYQVAEPRCIRRLEEYLEANCERPFTAEQLAEVAGVSVTTLYAGFRRFRGYTVMQFLKSVRLDRVRAELLVAEPGSSVAQIAAKWGFNHPGRFSAAYRERFGEAPSQTLHGR